MTKLNYQSNADYSKWWNENRAKLSGQSIYSKGAAIWNAALAAPAVANPHKTQIANSDYPAVANDALVAAAQAIMAEQVAASLSDPMLVLREMAADDEEVLVSAKLLMPLLAALAATPDTMADCTKCKAIGAAYKIGRDYGRAESASSGTKSKTDALPKGCAGGAEVMPATAATTQQPAGYLKRADLVKLGNCRAELWAKLVEADAVPLFRAPVVAKGWRMVPVKPTDAMLEAAAKSDDEGFEVGRLHGASSHEIYAAMLAAAPAAQVAGSAT